jgi:photosystem II stability/assembly factor-like uncharacterized protein
LNWEAKRAANSSIFPIIATGKDIFACSHNEGILHSSNGGTTWAVVDSGLTNNDVYSFAILDSTIFAGTQGGGVFRSTDNGTSWTESSIGLGYSSVNCFTTVDSTLYAGTQGAGVAHTTNSGADWHNTSTGMTDPDISGLTTIGSKIFASTGGGAILLSTDSGLNWVERKTAYTRPSINSLIALGTVLLAGAQDSGILRSTDEGLTWVNVGLKTSINVFIASGKYILASNGYEIFLSSDSGINWSKLNTNIHVSTFAVVGTDFFAGGDQGLFISTDTGISWNLTNWTAAISDPCGLPGLNDSIVTALAVIGTKLFLGSKREGIFLSTNLGKSWTNVSEGLPLHSRVLSLQVSAKDLFVGTEDSGVWRRPIAEMNPSGVNSKASISQFSVKNFPNPFSSQTTISLSNPERQFVDIRIMDLLGSECARLFSGNLDAGDHSYDWNASLMSSGIYFCIMRTANGVQKFPLVVEH